MKNTQWYLLAITIVALVGASLDRITNFVYPAFAIEPLPTAQSHNNVLVDEKKKENKDVSGVVVPMPMVCFPSKVAEESLSKEGFRILATGIQPDGEVGPELIETWMNSDNENFVILRVISTQGLSCAIAIGPLLRPGGIALKELEEAKPKGQPL